MTRGILFQPPGVSVRIFGTDYKGAFDLTFKIGDVAVYDSFNMVYTAKIESIGPKTIKVGWGAI
jgi:hypothetical protein